MAGIFGLFDFTKEGPGVPKNEPDKGPFLETIDILMRRFWELIKLNLMMILFQIPALILTFGVSLIALSTLFPELSVQSIANTLAGLSSGSLTPQQLEALAMNQLTFAYVLFAVGWVALTVIVVGPFQAGFAYVLRGYIRDEHVFMGSDFWEQSKANFKQSLIASMIGFIVWIILGVNFAFYHNSTDFINSKILYIIQVILILMCLIWVMMQAYIYPMIVTFKLSLGQIYRNSLLFVVLRFPHNLLQVAITLILAIGIPGYLLLYQSGVAIILAFFWFLLFSLSFPQFFSMAITWRALERFMIKRELHSSDQ